MNQTIENIKSNNAVGIYQSGTTWGSTIGIIFNNIQVGAKLYIYGIAGGVGTLFALLSNSVMLGSFQYFFYDYGALKDSARGIWLHGVFEIFAMVVEAMCGLILGASILFREHFQDLILLKKVFRIHLKYF